MEADMVPNTITELLLVRAEESPHGIACCSRDVTKKWVSTAWNTLWEEVQRVAGSLVELGLQKGDRLAILSGPCRIGC